MKDRWESKLIIIFAIFLLIVTGFSFSITYNSAMETACYAGRSISEETAARTETMIIEYETTLNDLTYQLRENINSYDTTEEIDGFLSTYADYLEEKMGCQEISVYGVIDGVFVGNYGETDSDFIAEERPWYVRASSAEVDIAYSQAYIDYKTGEMIVSFSKTINDNNDVLGLDVQLGEIEKIVKGTKLYGDMSEILFDASDNIIAYQCIEPELNSELKGNVKRILAAVREGTLAGQIEGESVFVDSDNAGHLLYYTPVSDEWYMVVAMSYDTALGNVFTSLKVEIVLIIIFVVVLYIALNLAKRQQQKNVENQKAVDALSQNLQDALSAANMANYAKSDFLSRMSHDIRTPLNAIIGMTAIAQAHIDDKRRVSDCLSKIDVSSVHLLKLINQVLDMSKIENGKIDLAEEKFKLRELIQIIEEIMYSPIQEKQHTLIIDDERIINNNVVGDSFRIQQILVNLLNNAVKYTNNHGIIKMTVREKRSGVEGFGRYEFIVEDNGIGMSQEFVEHIFEPFSREADSRTSEIEGTGLGMAITRNIVHMMNGDIKVDSRLGEGSKFYVTLYLKIQGQADAVGINDMEIKENVPDIKHPAKNNMNGKRILVVDDNQINIEIVKEILTDRGAFVECATNGKMAVLMFEISEEGYYDMILMDVQMRIMNGYEATREIRKTERKDALKLPIIAMTANAFAEDIEQAKNSGMSDHIAKPLDIGKMIKTMSKYLS